VTVQDVFGRIVGALEQTGIPYMLTGSFASSYHGMPRATQDIDIVIAANPDQLRTFANLLPAREYYVDLEEALEAHGRQAQFSVVDLSTGWKVDLIIRKERAFSRTEFERREPVELHGLRLYVATAEDLIVAKLEWAKLGGSQRQVEDVAGILRIRSGGLDHAYIATWVGDLDLGREWEAACRLDDVAS
jgi:hypothetical protein